MKVLFTLLSTLSVFLLQAQDFAELIIKDINIISPTKEKIYYNKSVGISKGIIFKIADFNSIKKSKQTTIINGKGKFLMPGLADMHVHLPKTAILDTFLVLNLMAGVTEIREMNSKEDPLEAMNRIQKEHLISPNIFYSYPEFSNLKYSKGQVDTLLKNIKLQGFDFIKVFKISDDTTFENFMSEANKFGTIVCGHYPNKNIKMARVIELGYRSIEHLGGYDKIKNIKELQTLTDLTNRYNVFNCPTLDYDYTNLIAQNISELKNKAGIKYAPKSYLLTWEQNKMAFLKENDSIKLKEIQNKNQSIYIEKLLVLKHLNEKHALLLIGSDVSLDFQVPGYNIYEEMKRFKNAGISNYNILKAATYNSALFFNQEKTWGSIKTGQRADMIILQKNPIKDIKNINSVQITIVNGHPYFIDSLKKLIE